MSVITITVPIQCPRAGCDGMCYAHLARRPVSVDTYYVLKVEDVCVTGLRPHTLTEYEWQRASDEAEKIATLWNDKQTRTA